VEILGREVQGALVAPRVALDFVATPAKLRTADGGGLDVDVGLCDAQRCEVRPHAGTGKDALAPGLRLRTAGGGE